jgi:hypothetical protein
MVFPRLPALLEDLHQLPVVLARRDIRALTEMAALVGVLANDFIALGKEHERTGDGNNFIDAVALDYGLSIPDAITTARAMLTRIMGLYLRLGRQVRSEDDPIATRLLTLLDSYLRGVLDWSLDPDNPRYHREIPPGEDDLSPLRIPIIEWWWRYDPSSTSATNDRSSISTREHRPTTSRLDPP